ncbi:MAG: TMEM165/GDT1 family protein [Halobacteriales archaeon]
MTGFLEILVAAFVLQLSVLPGEKVQLIIAGLSTKFNPFVVVAAAGSAFAGWTAVELLVGEALTRALPGIVLDGITAGLFLLFAVLLYRSAPNPEEDRTLMGQAETDGGALAVSGSELDLTPTVFGRDVPDRFGTFLPIFALMATGEFGDKTQLVTIGLAAQYGAHPAIWTGEMLAIIPISLANALFFHRFSHRFDMRKAHLFGAGLFAFFGLDTVLAITTGLFGESFSIWETIVGAITDLLLLAL